MPFPIFPTSPLQPSESVILSGGLCICPCVPLIIFTKFLVRTIEFRVELRGLHPASYLNLSSFPGAGSVTLFPCGFPDRIQMKTELTWDSYVLRDGGVWGSEWHWLLGSPLVPLKSDLRFGYLQRGETFFREICHFTYKFPNVSASSLPSASHLGREGAPTPSRPRSPTREPEPRVQHHGQLLGGE